jgi:integration host factor subunit beta
MTKSELIDAVAARGELTKARAELVVNCVFDTMIEAMRRGEGIEIRGFGSLTVRPYKPYEGRNPRTGQPVEVPAKRLPFFKVGKELRELVNASRHLAITGDEDDDDLPQPVTRERISTVVPTHRAQAAVGAAKR